MSFNWIDVLLLLLVLSSVAGGWYRGFILSTLDLVRSLGSLLAGLFFYQPVARLLGQLTNWTEVWNQPLAFLVVVILVSILIQLLGSLLLRRIPRDVHRQSVNRIFGVLPGLASGLITAAVISALLLAAPVSDEFSEMTRQSQTVNHLAGYTEELEARLMPIFAPAIQQTLNRRTTVQPGSNETVSLPFKVENTRARPDLETQMLELVNQERTEARLTSLVADPELAETARKHSIDMFARGYFSHYTPEKKDPFDRMRADGVRFLTAGENLAIAPSLQIAHTGLMNSPGHRANILRPAFGRVGIAIQDGGRRGLMVTQNFRN